MTRYVALVSAALAASVALAAAPRLPAAAFQPVVAHVSVKLQLFAEGFNSPLHLEPVPDGTGRLFVVDQIGKIWILKSDGTLMPEPFLDVSAKMVTLNPNYDERGLLGMTFHPMYSQNGKFYVHYSAPLRPEAPQNWNHTAHVAEYKVSNADPNKADPNSERIVMKIDQPQRNHNGGTITFGPLDGYMYIALGDGGGSNDRGEGHAPEGNGQNLETPLGKILRIDVDGGTPYAIPSDNPFVNKPGLDEIYAYGFRNPYRISFDRQFRRELLAADVGQNLFEEVDIVVKGGNYGWRIREGFHCFDPDNPNNPPPTCRDTGYLGEPLLDPIIEYGRPAQGGPGITVVGGYVYRGKALPSLRGMYIFGDWSTSFQTPDGTLLLGMRRGHLRKLPWIMDEIHISNFPNQRLGQYIVGFGQDRDGEVYVLSKTILGPQGATGKVYKIVPSN